jgi:hypothetical protein
MPAPGGAQPYITGHEYDLGNGATGVYNGKGFSSPEEYLAQKQARATDFADNQQGLQRLDRAGPMTERPGATGFWGGVESGEGAPSWSPFKGIGGTSGYDLNKELLPVRANTVLRNMAKLKAMSPTGSTGFGNMSDTEGQRLESTDAVLDTRQSRDQLQREIELSRQALIRHTPGIHPSNPIDLRTINPADVPEGAFFTGPDGKVYTQKKGAGATWAAGGGAQAAPAPAPVDPRAAANAALKAKSAKKGPVLLGYD